MQGDINIYPGNRAILSDVPFLNSRPMYFTLMVIQVQLFIFSHGPVSSILAEWYIKLKAGRVDLRCRFTSSKLNLKPIGSEMAGGKAK
jgi:hypothetical protein